MCFHNKTQYPLKKYTEVQVKVLSPWILTIHPKTFNALKRQLKGAKQHFKQREVLMINLQEAHLAPQALIFSWRNGKIIKNRLQDCRK